MKDSDPIIWFGGSDASGTHGSSAYVVVGTVIGRSGSWPPVYEGWDKVLKKYNLPYFHATEFNSDGKLVRHLTTDDRVSCVSELIDVISSVELEYLSYILLRKTFNKVFDRSMPYDFNIYDFLLASTISYLGESLEQYQSQVEEPVIGVLGIEEGCDLSATISDALKRAAARHKLGKLVNVSYLSKEQVPCQVADMIAYDSWKTFDDSVSLERNNPRRLSLRPSFVKIISGNVFTPRLLSEADVRREMPAVVRLFNMLLKK